MLDALLPVEAGEDTLVEGQVASSPDSDDLIEVVIPEFDASLRYGPCPYMPRPGVSPQRGDRCLVALADNSTTPWVIAWVPS